MNVAVRNTSRFEAILVSMNTLTCYTLTQHRKPVQKCLEMKISELQNLCWKLVQTNFYSTYLNSYFPDKNRNGVVLLTRNKRKQKNGASAMNHNCFRTSLWKITDLLIIRSQLQHRNCNQSVTFHTKFYYNVRLSL